MFPKINRIKKKKDFESIFRNSKSFKSSFFILKVLKNDLSVNRFGFVVSQKVSKKAVVRNKVKRRLVKAVKDNAGKIKSGIDLVFIALPGVENREFLEIKEVVNYVLVKSGLIKHV
jgi:ribonuclease P protein component